MVQQVATTLAERLKQLREQQWPGVVVTQKQLAKALGVSTPSISSWEKATSVPPRKRLADYAQFFATRSSIEQHPYRLIEELSPEEARARDELRSSLYELRDTNATNASGASVNPLGGPWYFPDGMPVELVCAEVPPNQLKELPTLQDPERSFANLYSYAALDALVELHGHVRAANPTSLVTFDKDRVLEIDDYTKHLVLLGGIKDNQLTRELMGRMIPIRQVGDDHFLAGDGTTRKFKPRWTEDGDLTEDVGFFFRAPNPFNRKRTVTICNGMYSRGTYGVVRALTDVRFRDRNAGYLTETFGQSDTYGVLMKIQVVRGEALTPDWTQRGTVLHTWSQPVQEQAS